MRRFGLGAAIAALPLLGMPAAPAAACGWLWACADQPYAGRVAPGVYGYRPTSPGWRHHHRRARDHGYPYAPWPTAWTPATRPPLRSALPGARTQSVGLMAPSTSAQGLLHSALPARGPTLFGPDSYGYGPYGYYGGPGYGYNPFPSRYVPPPYTPSWWAEPRRR